MNLELVKIINKAKINAVEVAFWINPKVQFITYADGDDLKTINKADIVDITIGKKDYLVFKNATRAEEKEAKKKESIGEDNDGNA